MVFHSPSFRSAMTTIVALMLVFCSALPAHGDYWADVLARLPHDPDFFVPYGDDQAAPRFPKPDISKRPTPRDSRTLIGNFAPDPQGTLRYYVVGGPHSSTCLGQPVSPLCTLETLIAGMMEGDRHLLEIGCGPFAKFFWLDRKPLPKGYTRFYRIYDVKRLGPDDLKRNELRQEDTDRWYPYGPSEGRPWRAGDIMIQTLYLNCKPQADMCDSHTVPITDTFRQVAPGQWALMSSYNPPY